jgi:hypothetical protein
MTYEELRATADKMISMLERLQGIELAKQQLAAGSDEFVVLAEEAERLTRVVQRWSEHQLELARTARRDLADERVKLADVRPRPLDRILADWREAQLRLETAEPGTPEALQAAINVERLRQEYQRAAGDKHREG